MGKLTLFGVHVEPPLALQLRLALVRERGTARPTPAHSGPLRPTLAQYGPLQPGPPRAAVRMRSLLSSYTPFSFLHETYVTSAVYS